MIASLPTETLLEVRRLVASGDLLGARAALVKYSDDQPRDEDGRFASGGEGGGSAPAGLGKPLEGPQPRPISFRSRNAANDAVRSAYHNVLPEAQRGYSDEVSEQLHDMSAKGLGGALKDNEEWKAQLGSKTSEDQARALVKHWAETSGDHSASAIAMQQAAEREFGLKGVARPWAQAMQDEAGARPEGKADQVFLREMYNQTQEELKSKGVEGMYLYRGSRMDDKSSGRYDGHRDKGWMRLQPLSSFSFDPSTAYGYTQGFEAHGRYGRIDGVWVPRERILSTPRTGFGGGSQQEIVVLGGTYQTSYLGWYGKSGPGLEEYFSTGGPPQMKKADPAGLAFGPDDDLDNADWPKRMPVVNAQMAALHEQRGSTTKAAKIIVLRSGGKRRAASLDPIVARLRDGLQALIDEHMPQVAKGGPLTLTDEAKKLLLAAYAEAMRAGWDDSGAEDAGWDDEQVATAAAKHGSLIADAVAALGAALLTGAVSAAMADARMGTYAASLNPVYEQGFASGVRTQGEINRVTWRTQEDGVVCDLCDERDGKMWFGDDEHPYPGDGGFGGPVCEGGWNCFAPGTEVSGRFVSAMRSRYRGEIIELRTAAGHRLAVTPNHPVATPRGFVAAYRLREGGEVLAQAVHVDVSSGDDAHDRPAPVEQVLELLEHGTAAWRGAFYPAREDLHGDAFGVEGDVYVVGTDRHLLDDGEAVAPQGLRHFRLVSPDPAAGTLAALAASQSLPRLDDGPSSRLPRGPEQAVRGLAASPAGSQARAAVADRDTSASEHGVDGRAVHAVGLREHLPRLAREVPTDDFLGGESVASPVAVLPSAVHAVGPAAEWDVRLSQPAGHDVDADAAFACEMLRRFPGLVAADQIIEVRRGWMDGHVYDLGSEGGWLVAGGIIASNCRCELEYELVPLPDSADSAAAALSDLTTLSTPELLRLRDRLTKAEWDPSEHPRDEHGEFTSGGGGFAAELFQRES